MQLFSASESILNTLKLAYGTFAEFASTVLLMMKDNNQYPLGISQITVTF